jgi:hypothetical protein
MNTDVNLLNIELSFILEFSLFVIQLFLYSPTQNKQMKGIARHGVLFINTLY